MEPSTQVTEADRPGAAAPIVFVIPTFEDAQASARVFAEIAAIFGGGTRIVLVDDGSVREPAGIEPLRAAGLRGDLIRLRRNVGHQRAIAVGLHHVAHTMPHARRVVVMDADGEDVPATVPQLLAALESDDIDAVVAQRRNRVESLWFKLFYALYRAIFQIMTGHSIRFGNFMALKPAAVHRLVAMQELWIHLASSVLTSRLRLAFRPLDRGPRYAGRSKLNFVALVLHGFRALMVFAEDVLVRVGIACTLVAALAVVGSIGALVLKVLGYATPGWFSVALGIMVLVFLQTGALTLMSLMLTGIVRGGSVSTVDYRAFVESVTPFGDGPV